MVGTAMLTCLTAHIQCNEATSMSLAHTPPICGKKQSSDFKIENTHVTSEYANDVIGYTIGLLLH